jgi:hypothetical protein
VEPPHSYVHETSTSVVHHGDYLNRRDDQALCGAALENPAPLDPSSRPVAVCPDCEAKVVEYHLKWWRERTEAATAELDELRVKYRALAEYVDDERRQVTEVSGEKPESRREIDEEPRASATAEEGETTPTPLLDRARKELLELCRQVEEAVPYWRLKNSMEAFSDTLEPDERVLLAREIGAEGSLIRWCTREIEGLGRQVANNPVHGDADDMMDAWTQDLYQTPKKTKWRLGRTRSHDGS